MDISYIYFFIGFIVVFTFATNFFNQPGYSFVDPEQVNTGDLNDELLELALPRYLTERFEYNFFRAAFVLVAECFYILLVLFLPEFNLGTATVENAISTGSAAVADDVATNPSNIRERIILATLIITGMAPNLPWIKELLEKSKLYLHKKAQIPYKGRAIYHRIKNTRPNYDKTMINDILHDQKYQGDCADGCRSDIETEYFEQSAWTLEARWAKLTYLLYFVQRWSQQLTFKSYIQNPELHYSSIDSHYQSLIKLMETYKAGEISGADRLKLETGLDSTLNRSYRLISCLLYLAANSDSVVDSYLDRLGYDSNEHNEFPIPWNTLIWIVFAVGGSIVIGSIVALLIINNSSRTLPEDFAIGEVISWIGYGTPFIILPVLLVLLIKRYLSNYSESWPTVTEQGIYHSIGERPWFIYFIAALSSYILGALVLLTLVISMKHFNKEDYQLIEIVPTLLAWSSVVFITAGFTAFRLDSGSQPTNGWKPFYLARTLGVLSQGLLTCGLIYLVTLYNADRPLHIIFEENYALDSKIYILCVIGFFLGVSTNIAIGIGRLRQRRKQGRYMAHRKLNLHLADHQTNEAETLNISAEGALISVKDINLIRDLQTTHNSPVFLSSENGHVVEATVIKKRGNHLHLLFTDIGNWNLLRSDLSLPSVA